MRKLLLLIGAVLVVIVATALAGPLLYPRTWQSFDAAAKLRDVRDARDLDAYLAREEAMVANIKPGLAKGIVWHDTIAKARTPLAIVYLHGFSASRRELSPVVEHVADSLAANVFFTRLTAHGETDGEAFATVHAQQWIDDAREAMAIGRRIGERVIVIATSTGATLALEMAAENPADIAALLLVSPNHAPQDPRAPFVSGPLGPSLARLIGGPYYGFAPDTKLHSEYWTTRYRSEAIPAMMDLVNHERSIDLSRMLVPTLTLYTANDHVVRVDLIRERHAQIGATRKEIVDVPEATRHEMASDALAPTVVTPVVNTMIAFVRTLDVRPTP